MSWSITRICETSVEYVEYVETSVPQQSLVRCNTREVHLVLFQFELVERFDDVALGEDCGAVDFVNEIVDDICGVAGAQNCFILRPVVDCESDL